MIMGLGKMASFSSFLCCTGSRAHLVFSGLHGCDTVLQARAALADAKAALGLDRILVVGGDCVHDSECVNLRSADVAEDGPCSRWGSTFGLRLQSKVALCCVFSACLSLQSPDRRLFRHGGSCSAAIFQARAENRAALGGHLLRAINEQ